MTLLPFDETGLNPTNRKSETHTVSSINGVEHNYIVPDHAPFFGSTLTVYHVEGNRFLDPNVDYTLTHLFEEAKEKMARNLYGSFTLLDKNITGTFKLVLQSLGGDFVNPETVAIESGLDTLDRLTSFHWDDLVTPVVFPPTKHLHPVTDVEAVTEIINEFKLIREAIASQFSHLKMADISDLDTGFIAPLMENLNAIAIAIAENAGKSNVVFAEKYLSESVVDLGPLADGVWRATPLMVTVPVDGTYAINWDVSVEHDGTGQLQMRYTMDGVALPKAFVNGGTLPLPKDAQIRVEVRMVSGTTTYTHLSSPTAASHLTITRLGH